MLSNIKANGDGRSSLMQFHLNGFEPGDPEISDPAERIAARARPDRFPKRSTY